MSHGDPKFVLQQFYQINIRNKKERTYFAPWPRVYVYGVFFASHLR